jgi:hypothetical protein
LEVPSRLFYGGLLEEHADRERIQALCGWDKLPQSPPLPFSRHQEQQHQQQQQQHRPRGTTAGASSGFPLLMIGE